MKVTTNVKRVAFEFNTEYGMWTIKVGASYIKALGGGPVESIGFSSLLKAADYAKVRGLIPPDFKITELQKHTEVNIDDADEKEA